MEREGKTEWNWYKDGDGAKGTAMERDGETERDGEIEWGGMRSESVREWEWEWETERDWEWEGMRETICFESFERDCFEFLVRSTVKSSPTELILTYKNRVRWTQFSYIETEFNRLDFWADVDILSNSDTGKITKSNSSHSIYNPKIHHFRLELLDRKNVWNIS